MFGSLSLPLSCSIHQHKLNLTAERSHFQYTRHTGEDTEQKKLLGQVKAGEFYLEPVEPVHSNIKVSKTLMLELREPLLVLPGISQLVYLTFPVELMVTLRGGKKPIAVDSFSVRPRKLALYGVPNLGLICHYWKTSVSLIPPKIEPYAEGVVGLTIQNFTENPVEVTKAVFASTGMKIYYDAYGVSMMSMILIKENGMAETVFLDKPLRPGMTRSHEMIAPTGLLSGNGRFIMEYGV